MTPWSIYPGIRPESGARIFFWNCYPYNLVPLFPGLRRQMQRHEAFAKILLSTLLLGYFIKTRKFVKKLLKHNALVFMDRTNVENTKRYMNVKIDEPLYLPVAIDGSSGNAATKDKKRDLRSGLRVTWIGRVVDFKYFTLLHALREMNRLQSSFGIPFDVSIVGAGEYLQRLKAETANLHNLNCKFIDHIAPRELDRFLINETDMVVAMGTSALQGARLGIPTILLDIAHGPVSDGYVFSWLYQRDGFTLGDIIPLHPVVLENDSLRHRVKELINDFRGASEKTLNYFKQNHEMDTVALDFLRFVDKSSCTYGDLSSANFFDRGFVYPFFKKIREKVCHT